MAAWPSVKLYITTFFLIFLFTDATIVIDVPDNQTTSTDPGLPTAIITWSEPSISGNNDDYILISSHNSGDVFPIGTTTVTYTATDSGGETTTASFTVLVLDNEPPSVTNCPGDIISTSAVVSWIEPNFTDNSGTVNIVNQSHSSGSTFSLGTTKVIYTAQDLSLNSKTCTFQIEVLGK